MVSFVINLSIYTIIMKIYLVGGAVRDQLLGRPVKEKDWVVVGASVDEMLKKGFRPVGKDFPVFLHPETHEEYALARTERKTGRGYTAFDFNASPDVTLEEDLMRRDLTINAMAQSVEGELIDPYHGKDDLQQKLLRHVSPAFIEDPVRILRVARFAARFGDFRVAAETNQLMQQMVENGEVNALVAERVWKELERALGEDYPQRFFEVLDACGALRVLFPDIKKFDVLINENKNSVMERFALLLQNVPEDNIKLLCDRYRVPKDYREFALLVARYQNKACETRLSAEEIVDLLQHLDAFRREERFKKFLNVCGGR